MHPLNINCSCDALKQLQTLTEFYNPDSLAELFGTSVVENNLCNRASVIIRAANYACGGRRKEAHSAN